ncbi:MAG: hypothetical protein AB7U18_17185, partial [Dehalococcoidia bacterium]
RTITWTTIVGAIYGVLGSLVDPRPTHELMGMTGHAFRLALTEQNGVVAAGSAAAAADFARVLPLYRNTGRAFALIEASPADRGYTKLREKAIKQIRKSISRRRPVVAFDLHLPEFGIVFGYDDRMHTLEVSSLMSSQYGATLAESRWPVPEQEQRLIVLVTGKEQRIERARAERDALRFALDYAAHGDPGDPTRAAHGLTAFARWRAAFEQGREIDPAGNARIIQTVQTARRDAARFLRENVAGTIPAAASDAAVAATAYDRVALAFSRMATLFPYPAGGDVTGAAGRLVALAALREAEEHERAALYAIESIYSR